MNSARPIYLLVHAGADTGLDGLVPGREVVRVSTANELRDLAPGLLLIPLDAAEIHEVMAALRVAAQGPSESGWLPVLVEPATEGCAARMIPISIGWPAAPDELVRWVDGAE